MNLSFLAAANPVVSIQGYSFLFIESFPSHLEYLLNPLRQKKKDARNVAF